MVVLFFLNAAGADYVSIQTAAKVFGFSLIPGGWKYKTQTLKFIPHDSTFVVGGKKYPLYRFSIRKKRLYVHPDELANAAYRLSGRGWFWNGKRFFTHKPTVHRLILSEKRDSSYIIINGGKFEPVLISSDKDRVVLKVRGAFYPKYSFIRGDGKIIRSISISHESDGMVLRIEKGSDFGFFHMQEGKSYLKIIFFRGFSGGYVILDPGHGGKDPGAVANGYREKDIVLSVAKKVRRILERNYGLKVKMTRDRDVFISLRRRSEIANNNRTLVFVSIHCNYSRNRRASGPETYFLSTARTNHERAVELLENSVIKYEMEGKKGDLEFIVSDLLQNAFLKESQKLAFSIHSHLVMGNRDRGVRQAGFYVLRKIYAPSVLVELGYISNRKEARLLASEKYQWELARRIARGISEYLQEYVRR